MKLFKSQEIKLIDLLEGFIDIHCHVLPGIDDGAANVDESIQLIKKYMELGFKGVIATPHILKGAYPNTEDTISKAYKTLMESKNLPSNFQLTYAAEHMIDEDFEQMINAKTVMKLAGDKVLVEMSYRQKPTALKDILFKLVMAGYKPILAHPERYVFLEKLDDFKELFASCDFQINALSLSNYYGPEVKKKAYLLLKNGMYNYIGTDTHHLRHLDKLAEVRITKKHLDSIVQIVQNTRVLTESI